jgi:hypothetical protein
MASQGSYPLNGRVPAGSDTATGVVAGATADIPLADIASLVVLTPATTEKLGGVRPDGTTITVTTDGVISAVGAGGGTVVSVVAGAGIAVDSTNPANPVVSATGTAIVESVVAGTGISVNSTDPANPIVTSTVTASSIGLGNVNNTSDANKPVSTAQQTALNLKANAASPSFTGMGIFVNDGGVPASLPGLPIVGLVARAVPPVSTSGIGAHSTIGMYGWSASGTTNCPGFTAGRSFGAAGLQGAVTANHDLFSLNGAASDGTDFQLCASIVMYKAAGTTTATDSAGMVRFFVTPVGSVLPVEVVRILSSGEVGINTTAATADKLNVNGSARFGAVLLGQFTLTTLPSAASFSGYTIDVTNATGGPKQCRSNGTNWLITNTTTTVS